MSRRRERPDAKIVPFPDNHLGDDSPAAHRAIWGPNHNTPPLRISEVVLVDRGKLIAKFSVFNPLFGDWVRGYRLVRWGAGQRVMLPQSSRTVPLTATDDDGKVTVTGYRTYYTEMTWFASNRSAKAFEEAALAAVRPAVDRLRSEQPSRRSATVVDDDVPF